MNSTKPAAQCEPGGGGHPGRVLKRGARPYGLMVLGLAGKARGTSHHSTSWSSGDLDANADRPRAQGAEDHKLCMTMPYGESGSFSLPQTCSPLSGSGRSCWEEASGDEVPIRPGARPWEQLGGGLATHPVHPCPRRGPAAPSLLSAPSAEQDPGRASCLSRGALRLGEQLDGGVAERHRGKTKNCSY